MLDNNLIQLFLPIINTGLLNLGFSNITIVQDNQPTQQGISTSPSLYFYKLFDKRYGYTGRTDVWDSISQTMIHTETQYYETTFQISSIVRQDPGVISYTASDLINNVAAILQSEYAVNLLLQSNVSILRISDIRNPYFVNDRDQYDAFPSFDFVLTHQQVMTTTSNVVSLVDYEIDRV